MLMMKRFHDQNEMSIFLADESRRTGTAQEICFPQTADEIVQLCRRIRMSRLRFRVAARA